MPAGGFLWQPVPLELHQALVGAIEEECGMKREKAACAAVELVLESRVAAVLARISELMAPSAGGREAERQGDPGPEGGCR